MTAPRVFVSHSHQDNDWCRKFVESLRFDGEDVWYDDIGLSPSESFVKRIEQEIETRPVFLVVLTPEAWDSSWVQREVQLALVTQRTIVPVLLRPTTITGFLRAIQWVDVIGMSAPEAATRVLPVLQHILPTSFAAHDRSKDLGERMPATSQNPYTIPLNSASTVNDLLRTTLTYLIGITQTDYNQIFLLATSAYTQQLVAVADAIPPHKQRYRIATYSGLLGQALSRGEAINAGDTASFPDYLPAVAETKSELVVPIASKYARFGVMNSESEAKQHFTASMQQEIGQLAAALGQALPVFGWSTRMEMNALPWIQL
jgi:hypothetical protein